MQRYDYLKAISTDAQDALAVSTGWGSREWWAVRPSNGNLKTRTLVCVVSDAATGREPELRIHLRMALRQGWSETELIETLIHMSGYVGVPIIREAMIAAGQVFAEVKAEG